VDQGGCDEGGFGSLMPELTMREPPKLLVDERHELIERMTISVRPGREQARHVRIQRRRHQGSARIVVDVNLCGVSAY